MTHSVSVFHEIAPLRRWFAAAREANKTIGLVPTMGALHAGHLSLVRAARRECDLVLATIFVNPTQFGPSEDFNRYPRTVEADLDLLASEGCTAAFLPANEIIYPPGFSTFIEPPAVSIPLEGKLRPGHFRGVATIVLKLFNLAPADAAYFGQKDYQQAAVITQMVADLNVPIRIIVCQIIREPDGLAMSSRNRYLSPADRQRAICLSQALVTAEELIATGTRDVSRLLSAMTETLAGRVDRLEYVTIADRQTLEPLATLDRPAVALIAAYVGQTRLIDNQLLNPLENPAS